MTHKTSPRATAQEAVALLHEIGMLGRIERSGFAFLGSGKQSVAAHSFRVAILALMLSEGEKVKIDEALLLKLCLFHDVMEARIGDLNYVQKRYLSVDRQKLFADWIEEYPYWGAHLVALEQSLQENSLEAALMHDADQLDLLLCLKEEMELGNSRAADWYAIVQQRLRLARSNEWAKEILEQRADTWWFRRNQSQNRSLEEN